MGQPLDQVAAVQVYVGVRAFDGVFGQPVGQPLGVAAAGVAGEAAVEVLAVNRVEVNTAGLVGGHVDDGEHGEGACQRLRVGLGDLYRRRDAGVLGPVYPGSDEQLRPRPGSPDDREGQLEGCPHIQSHVPLDGSSHRNFSRQIADFFEIHSAPSPNLIIEHSTKQSAGWTLE